MKDFLGTDVQVGDHIFYSTTGRYSESRLCEIVKIGAKTVTVKILKSNRPGYKGQVRDNIVVRNDFIKVII